MRKRDYSYLTVISLFYINNLKNSLLGAILLMEPHAGIEPASTAWQAVIIAVIRMRRLYTLLKVHK